MKLILDILISNEGSEGVQFFSLLGIFIFLISFVK